MYKKLIVLSFIAVFCMCSFAFSKPVHKVSAKKKPAAKTSVTISKEQYDALMNRINSMQQEIDNLKNQSLNPEDEKTSKIEKTELSAEKDIAPDSDSSTQSASSKMTEEDELRALQQEQLLNGEEEQAQPIADDAAANNPKISVIGDFLWHINHTDSQLQDHAEAAVHEENHDHESADEHEHESADEHLSEKAYKNVLAKPGLLNSKHVHSHSESPFEMREIEFAFQQNIDPWSRADIYAALEKDGEDYKVHLEEAFITLNRLPLNMQMRAGKMLLPFGKDCPTHQHALPYVDRPLAVAAFLGEEGMAGTGFELSGMVPLGRVYAELTAMAVKHSASPLFDEHSTGKPTYALHGRAFSDLGESSNIEAGYSRIDGYPGANIDKKSTLQGVDLTWRWKPLKEGNYRSAMLRGEYFWSKKFAEHAAFDSKGWYLFGQYQLNKNWYLGARTDYCELPELPSLNKKSLSGILTYFPTENSYYRLQYNRVSSNYQPTVDQWLFQLNFLIGPHGQHKF